MGRRPLKGPAEGNQTLQPASELEVVSDVSSEAGEPNGAAPATVPAVAIDLVLASLDNSKAEEIAAINLQGKSALADHMVVASGRSHRHVVAVADHLLRDLKEQGFGSAKVEGLQNGDWVLIDTGDIIVHIFRPEVRAFYNIEKMWSLSETAESRVH